MALSEFRDTHSWQGAIELGPQLVRLAEDLPAAEQMGLSLQLRQAMIEIPATAAADLLQGSKDTRLLPVLRLLAILDLIEKIYPALDTAVVRKTADNFAESIIASASGEQPGAAAAYLPGPTTAASDEHPAVVHDNEPPAPPSTVPVVPEAVPGAVAAAPATPVPEAASSKIHVTPDGVVVPAPDHQENNVHPDSVQ